jgi:hypothetical protein
MKFHLAQLNIGRIRAPLDSPVMAGFVALLPVINALAESTPGFVWRLVGDGADATGLRPYEDPLIIVNMSVWESLSALRDYAYRSNHVQAFRRRKEWFEESEAAAFALWWIPAGTLPTVAEAKERLETLREKGPTPEAFTFKESFPAPV